jgi:hypothetical protein
MSSVTPEEYIQELIDGKYQGDSRRTLGRCKEEVEAMHEAFPELVIVKGFIYTDFGAGYESERIREHWWLKDEEGTIFDPTAGQFPFIECYREYKEGDDVRIGKCMHCGTVLWGQPGTSKTFCNDDCADRCFEYRTTGRYR